ncbi:MAG: glycerate kinase [Lachnospiraceae bacterium]|nr:glycerate kinase [Lachnospiraceae bacterium]
MKKCIVISDSFKGTLSSVEICAIAKESIPRFFPECEVDAIPVADGGEGTVACFVSALGAELVETTVSGPYFEKVRASYARIGSRAVIETAAAAGLPLVGERRNPAATTTYGVGELIRHARTHGCGEIFLGIGGSATNDGGCGCAAALGVRFLDREGRAFVPTGECLSRIASIDCGEAERLLGGARITVMCDVTNPLHGEHGAAFVFGPQKGADPDMVRMLDGELRAFGRVLREGLGRDVSALPGAGAAGGMGGGMAALFGAELRSGIEAILDMVDFDRRLLGADLVITGEGRVDGQSMQGKVLSGVAGRTKRAGVPLVVIAGGIGDGAEAAYEMGVTAMFGIDRPAVAFEDYGAESGRHYQAVLEDVLRLGKAAGKW